MLGNLGVERAWAEKQWPADVVAQVLRDRAGTFMPLRHDLSPQQALHMVRRLQDEEAGVWRYEVQSVEDEDGNYTVWARATRSRPGKFATRQGGEDMEGEN